MTVLHRSSIPSTLQLRVGDSVEVSLEAQTGAGYTWDTQSDTGGRVEVTHSFTPGSGIGSPAQQIFRITALGRGDEHLRFVYRRAWEADRVQDEFEVAIQIV